MYLLFASLPGWSNYVIIICLPNSVFSSVGLFSHNLQSPPPHSTYLPPIEEYQGKYIHNMKQLDDTLIRTGNNAILLVWKLRSGERRLLIICSALYATVLTILAPHWLDLPSMYYACPHSVHECAAWYIGTFHPSHRGCKPATKSVLNSQSQAGCIGRYSMLIFNLDNKTT